MRARARVPTNWSNTLAALAATTLCQSKSEKPCKPMSCEGSGSGSMPFGNAASPAFAALLCKAAKNGMSATPPPLAPAVHHRAAAAAVAVVVDSGGDGRRGGAHPSLRGLARSSLPTAASPLRTRVGLDET